MSTDKNKQKLKVMRICCLTALAMTALFLGLGLPSLVSKSQLLPFGVSIAFTVIGGICGFASFYLVFFSFVIPGMMKLSVTQTSTMLELQQENIEKMLSIQKEAVKNSVDAINEANAESSVENKIYCKYCGQLIDGNSVFCKYCGKKQDE